MVLDLNCKYALFALWSACLDPSIEVSIPQGKDLFKARKIFCFWRKRSICIGVINSDVTHAEELMEVVQATLNLFPF